MCRVLSLHILNLIYRIDSHVKVNGIVTIFQQILISIIYDTVTQITYLQLGSKLVCRDYKYIKYLRDFIKNL